MLSKWILYTFYMTGTVNEVMALKVIKGVEEKTDSEQHYRTCNVLIYNEL